MLRLLKAMRTKRKAKASCKKAVAAQAAAFIGPKSEFLPDTPVSALPTPQIVQRLQRAQATTVGMQGYAPILRISQNRRYCEFCAERVVSGARHVCWGNAEHHMHTLNDDERTRILAQLGQ